MGKARRYAQDTTVPVTKSKADIERLLMKHGATSFVSGWDDTQGMAALQFQIEGRFVKFRVYDPDPGEFRLTGTGREREPAVIERAVEKERKRRWRALLLIIKAKLELVASGDSTIEREFMADMMLPDGSTVSEWIQPQLDQAYNGGKMPLALPGSS